MIRYRGWEDSCYNWTGQAEDGVQGQHEKMVQRSLSKAWLRRKSLSDPPLVQGEKQHFFFFSLNNLSPFLTHHLLFIQDQLNLQLRLADGCHLPYCETQRH